MNEFAAARPKPVEGGGLYNVWLDGELIAATTDEAKVAKLKQDIPRATVVKWT